MKKKTYVKWFLLVSTALGSLTSFSIYNSLKKENSKSIKIDYNKVHLMLNDKGFRKIFLNSNNLGKNSQKFDEMLKSNISSFQKKKYNLDNLVDKSKKIQSKTKCLNLKNYHVPYSNGELTSDQRNYLSVNNNLFGNLFNNNNKNTLSSASSQSWDDWTDKTRIDWIALSKSLEVLTGLFIAVAVIAAAAAVVFYALSVFTFGATLGEAIMCSQICIKTATVSGVVGAAIAVINGAINKSDDRYTQMRKIQKIYLVTVVSLGVLLLGLNVSYIADSVACPAVLITIACVSAVLAVIAINAHDQDEASNYFLMEGTHFNKNDLKSYGLKIRSKNNVELDIGAKHQYSLKLNMSEASKDFNELEQIIPKVPHNNMFKFHGQWFDTDEINYYSVDVVNDKNTTFVLNNGGIHRFNENISQANQDYDYLQSILTNDGKGINFGFHGQSFDATKVNSFDVQVTDNKNTTLTIDDGKKHQFKQSLNDSSKDYDFLESIMLGRGQGENFNFHKQTFNIRKVNFFDSNIINNKNTLLTIDDGQKHQFNESLAKANQDYDYLLSIMPNLGQGEIFKFHGQSFDLRKVNSFDVQVSDNKNTVLTIDDVQKHQFNQNLTDSNQDYDYLQSIMPNKGQGKNFIIHNESFDLRKVNSYDVQVIDANNTVFTIDDGKKHQFKQNLAESEKDYTYLESIMPGKGQGKNFNFHGQSFDITKVNSYDVQVIDSKNTVFTINDGKKHQFNQNLADSEKDYTYLESIIPNEGKGINFGFHGQSFDATKVNSFDVQVIDSKNTVFTINDGIKHQFNQNLDDSNKDYDFLQSIMPKHGQGENFNFHGQSFDLRKVNSYDVQVIDAKHTVLTITTDTKCEFNQNLTSSNQDYAFLQSIMPGKGKGEIFKLHDQSFDLGKVNSFNVQV
ncbi:MAG: hypothetical protein ACRDCG_01275, partial [Mycoplasmoidaceae bacterium]